MTTLTIEIPDSERASILKVVKKAGGNVLDIDTDDDLSEAEFKLLQESYKEALQIKDGKIKAIPASELWND
jgi:hypothetical protein